MSFRNQELSLQATCAIVLAFLSAHQVPERAPSFPYPDSFLRASILPHSRWLPHTLAKWLPSFLFQGWGDHLLPLMTGRRASCLSSSGSGGPDGSSAGRPLCALLDALRRASYSFLCNLNAEQIQTSREAEMKRLCLLSCRHLPSEHLSANTVYIFQGDKVTLNELAKAVTEHAAVCILRNSTHWGCWFALTIARYFYFCSLLHSPFVLHNAKEILLTLISSVADKHHPLLW